MKGPDKNTVVINVEIVAQKSQICIWNLNLVKIDKGCSRISLATLLQHSHLAALDTSIILLHRMGCAYKIALSTCETGMQFHVVTSNL